jgi:phosphoribosylamine---glycine ligase
MKVLVIGGGGREHSIIWKLTGSPTVKKVYCAPGNAGIDQIAECIPINANQIGALSDFAIKNKIDLTVVGSEEPLSKGIVDVFNSRNLRIFGPSAAAAEIEGSKVFTKQLMKNYNIPTAHFETFDNSDQARKFIKNNPGNWVIKTDGLAAGKGVILPDSQNECLSAISDIMDKKLFGSSGHRIVIEERLMGDELSVFAITDGKDYIVLPPSQDHKRVFDNNNGKNTGGMGAYAPTPQFSSAHIQQIQNTIIEPTINAMMKENRIFKGVLYCGIMQTKEGPKVIEFNCRFGDPECQVLMPLIKSDLFELFWYVSHERLSEYKLVLNDYYSVCVVIASGGYPEYYEKNKIITGLDKAAIPNSYIFHAGTEKKDNTVITSGGRVLGVTAWDDNLNNAVNRVYLAVDSICFDKMHYRKDIAKNALT